MNNRKSLSLQIAGATILAMLFGTSAFAESRHQSETSRGSGGHIDRSGGSRSSGTSVQRDRSVTRSQQGSQPQTRSADRGSWGRGNDTQRNTTRDFSQRDNAQRDNTQRMESRDTQRNDWRNNNSQRSETRNNNQRNDNRDNSNRNNSNRNNNNRNNNNQRYDNRNNQRNAANDRFRNVEGWRPGSRAPYSNHERVSSYGRVNRFERWHGGYRVWIGGGLFPIFVPFQHWRLNPLRIGLNIRFGGYWDPLGYWSVYDYSPYDGYYGGGYYNDRYDTAYTRGDIRGVVESVDYRRGTMVLNDDISRQFVTVTLPRDRRIDDVRPGDYVEFSGDWTRRGVFEAYRLERFDEGRGDSHRDDGRY